MKLAAIVDSDTAVGLRLGGIHEVYIPGDSPRTVLDQIEDQEDIGVLFITEEIADTMQNDLKEFRLRHDTPIIVEIPNKQGRSKDHVDYISHLIKKAVGIDITKKE
jgi:V/A-type H+-transporting ATPase subunit F